MYLASLVIVFLVLRRLAIVSNFLFNPDEGELLADGRRAAASLIPLDEFTSPTFGPLWPMVLGTLSRLGLPLTLPIAHLVSALMGAITCISMSIVIGRNFSRTAAVLLVTPLAIQWGLGFGGGDFLSLSTELLPLVLLSIACVVGLTRRPTYVRSLVAASLFGAVVPSKYIFAPLALIGLAALFIRMCKNRLELRRSIIVVAGGSISVYFFIVAPALLAGVPEWKITESIRLTLAYARGGGLPPPGVDWGLRPRLSGLGTILLGLPSLSILIAAAVGLLGVRNREDRRREPRGLKGMIRRSRDDSLRICGAASIVVAFVLLFASYPYYTHYDFLLFGGAVLGASIASIAPVDDGIRSTEWFGANALRALRLVGLVVVVMFCATGLTAFAPSQANPDRIDLSEVFDPIAARREIAWNAEGEPLSAYCPPGSRVLVWGWSPDLYAIHDWYPASRYVTTVMAMAGNSLHVDDLIYKPRLAQELASTDIACVVDAATAGFFGTWQPDASMEQQMPGTWRELEATHTSMTFYLGRKIPFIVLVPRSSTSSER